LEPRFLAQEKFRAKLVTDLKNKNWGFIGCGNLSQAIIRGSLSKKILQSRQIGASNRSQDKLKKFSSKYKIKNFKNDYEKLLVFSEVVVLGVKPQDLSSVLINIAPFITTKHIIFSLAAGFPAKILLEQLKNPQAILRVMTNLPASIQKGSFAVRMAKGSDHHLKSAVDFFGALGFSFPVKEKNKNSDQTIDIVTAGMASGTGMIYFLMEAFSDWFVKKGFSKTLAREVITEVFLGTAELAKQNPEISLSELRKAVTSKKGTTLAGLKAMKSFKIHQALHKSLDLALNRAVDISKSLRQKRK
jgi:pyrroline-5-carboxylate reductase